MSSTTMHLSPGLPILKSKDLVNWEIAGYVYDTLGDNEALTLQNGQNACGKGSWSGQPVEAARIPLHQSKVYLKAECDFKNRADTARFFYSLDGRSWNPIGAELKMRYTIPHFMGYRFALFHYATKTAGGFVDFDFFRVSDKITE